MLWEKPCQEVQGVQREDHGHLLHSGWKILLLNLLREKEWWLWWQVEVRGLQGRDQGSGDQGCGTGVLRHLLQMFGLPEGSSLGGHWIHSGCGQETVLSKMPQREICSAVQLLFSAHRPQGGWDHRPEVDGTRSGLAPRVLQMYRLRDHPGQQEGNQVLPNHGAKKGASMRRLQPKKKRLRRFFFFCWNKSNDKMLPAAFIYCICNIWQNPFFLLCNNKKDCKKWQKLICSRFTLQLNFFSKLLWEITAAKYLFHSDMYVYRFSIMLKYSQKQNARPILKIDPFQFTDKN